MINTKNPIIAVVDSGIGGVSILNSLIQKFGAGNYIYFADNEYMPYGNKSRQFIRNRVENIIKLLNETYQTDLIILACNTASSSIDLSKYDNVIGMTFIDDQTYLATELTKRNLNNSNVIADNKLASLIEKHIFDQKYLEKLIKQRVDKYALNKYDQLVLGCTHYELVRELFHKYCPDTRVINNSSSLVRSLDNVIYDNLELNLQILLSRQSARYSEKIKKLIKSI